MTLWHNMLLPVKESIIVWLWSWTVSHDAYRHLLVVPALVQVELKRIVCTNCKLTPLACFTVGVVGIKSFGTVTFLRA